MPSTVRIFSGGGGGRAAGPANLDPKTIPGVRGWGGGVGGLPAPVVRPASSSILDAMTACSSCSASFSWASAMIAGNGLEAGFEPIGCWIDTKLVLVGWWRYGHRIRSLRLGIESLFGRGSSDGGKRWGESVW
jgi:hypothetical protein